VNARRDRARKVARGLPGELPRRLRIGDVDGEAPVAGAEVGEPEPDGASRIGHVPGELLSGLTRVDDVVLTIDGGHLQPRGRHPGVVGARFGRPRVGRLRTGDGAEHEGNRERRVLLPYPNGLFQRDVGIDARPAREGTDGREGEGVAALHRSTCRRRVAWLL
jgi:hypothetical protein